MRNITHVVLEEINLGLLDEVGMIATDDFFSRCLVCVWFESCMLLTNILQHKPPKVAVPNKVNVLFNFQTYFTCMCHLVSVN